MTTADIRHIPVITRKQRRAYNKAQYEFLIPIIKMTVKILKLKMKNLPPNIKWFTLNEKTNKK